MPGGWKQRFNIAADLIIGILGGASFLSGMAFAAICAERGIYSLVGWNYHFESVGQYLHLTASRQRVWSWDRSWLLAMVAVATGCIASLISEFRQWMNKTPGERRAERQAERDRLAAEKAAKKERALIWKQNRKPMSGWRRLWIVLSVVFGAAAFTIAWDAHSRASADIPYSGNDLLFWSLARADAALQGCDVATMKAVFRTTHGWWVSCETKDPFTPALLWFFAPGIVMAVIGLTVRWIWRGFRPPKVGAEA